MFLPLVFITFCYSRKLYTDLNTSLYLYVGVSVTQLGVHVEVKEPIIIMESEVIFNPWEPFFLFLHQSMLFPSIVFTPPPTIVGGSCFCLFKALYLCPKSLGHKSSRITKWTCLKLSQMTSKHVGMIIKEGLF